MHEITGKGGLHFGAGMDNVDADFRLLSSRPEVCSHYDVLIFTDSKGSVTCDPELPCWTDLLAEVTVARGLSCLVVSRPKVLTTFFTLLNFLQGNRISYRCLVTNVGFVDFTPKKEEYMADIMAQAPSQEIRARLSYRGLSSYQLSSGQDAQLFTFEYGGIEDLVAAALSRSFEYSLLVGTMEFSPQISIPRQRPPEFYSQLVTANDFSYGVSRHSRCVHFVQPLKYPTSAFQQKLSDDAVHFTGYGHQVMHRMLLPFVESYILRDAR